MLKRCVMVLGVLTCVVGVSVAQTVDSEAQLASALCQNPKEETRNELLLNSNAHLVNLTLWNTLLDRASTMQDQGSAAKSIEIYKLTLRVADRLNKPELVGTTYYYLGRAYSLMSEVEDSIEAYETSRKIFEQGGIERNLIYTLADLGASYLTIQDDEKAQSYSEQSLAIAGQMKSSPANESIGPVEYGQARSLHTLGQIDLRQGNHKEAIRKLTEALAFYEGLAHTRSSYHIQMADVLIVLARVYGEMGEYGRAFSYLTRAHQVSRNSGDKNTLANIIRNQAALLLDQEDYATAETYLKESLRTYRSLRNRREEARVLLYLAIIERQQGRPDDALRLFQRSMERAQAMNLVDVQIDAGEGLGVVLTTKRDFSNALNGINRSLEIARRVNAKPLEAKLLWRAAQTYYAMQNYGESAVLAEQALTLARSRQLPKLAYFAMAALGEAYAADAKIELAITILKEAVNQVEAMRDQVAGRQEGLQLFFENKIGPYHTLVKLLTRQGNNFEALIYAERAKGRVLLEAVRNNRTDLRNIYTEAEKAEAEFLRNKLQVTKERIQSGETNLKNELDVVRRELALFQERLVTAHPELLLRAGPAQDITRARLNTLIPTNDFAYLEYVVTAETVGVFLLKRNAGTTDPELKFVNLPVNADELRRKVDEFHSAVAERHPNYDSLGRELYRLLLAPVVNEFQDIKTVCIIPDGFLWTLPFQALITPRGNYVVHEYSLFYAPSLSVLNEMALRRQQTTTKESLIAFANPVIKTNEELKQALHPIPEAEAEVRAISATVRTRVKKVLVGPQADERTFKSLASQYATIHLATHGVLDNRDPLNSYLLLTKTDGDPENDGLVQVREIIDMRLNADLAVLSACETGNGRIRPGEGVIGMSWAFLVAGARSVVVSQWRVNSASTSQLMKNFYDELARHKDLNGRNKSQALREASLRLLKDRRYSHPFYWAGFVLVSSN